MRAVKTRLHRLIQLLRTGRTLLRPWQHRAHKVADAINRFRKKLIFWDYVLVILWLNYCVSLLYHDLFSEAAALGAEALLIFVFLSDSVLLSDSEARVRKKGGDSPGTRQKMSTEPYAVPKDVQSRRDFGDPNRNQSRRV